MRIGWKLIMAGAIGVLMSATGVTGAQAAEQPLSNNTAMYPRVIELQYGPEAGTFLASATTFTDRGGEAAIFASTDRGDTFTQRSSIPAAQINGSPGLCCGSLFELPQAVGDMPAGTVLWAGTVGQDAQPRRTSIDVWRSFNAGEEWQRLGVIAQSTHDGGLWEPEFSIDAAGNLAVYFAEEGPQATNRPQHLVRMSSTDGLNWGDRRVIVQSTNGAGRPGMPNVRQLPSGSYMMVYEICGSPGQYDCAVYTRSSPDGSNWGDPLGQHHRLVSTNGRYFVAAPTFTWAPDGTADGRLVVVAQMLRESNGEPAPGNGATLLVSDGDPGGPWREEAAPVKVPEAQTGPCPNYSSTLVPTDASGTVLEIATRGVDGTCKAFFATGATGT